MITSFFYRWINWISVGYILLFLIAPLHASSNCSISDDICFSKKQQAIQSLTAHQISYMRYGDFHTLIIPTDHYFLFNSAQMNDRYCAGLMTIAHFLSLFPATPIYIGGFTDNIGSYKGKNNLSLARAQSLLTFLWAHGFSAKLLSAEGYGEEYAISDNHLVRGKAQNRRIEIQWASFPSNRKSH